MLTLFAVTFLYVCLRATQQLNVVGGHYWYVIPVSFLMAVCDVTIVLAVVEGRTLLSAIPMGFGGAMGACTAMWAHKRFIG